jgi:hypothetical protein
VLVIISEITIKYFFFSECIGKDLSVLVACNHSVTTDGSFGFWASALAGGEIFTEYGLIVPDAFTNQT